MKTHIVEYIGVRGEVRQALCGMVLRVTSLDYTSLRLNWKPELHTWMCKHCINKARKETEQS